MISLLCVSSFIVASAAENELDAVSLAALPPAERRIVLLEHLEEYAGDTDEVARASAALGVTKALDEQGRDDPSIVRLFLTAALDGDPAIRESAVKAAREGGDPPLTTARAPAPVPTSSPGSSPSPISPETLRRYRSSYMYRDDLAVTTGAFSGSGTGVYGSIRTVHTWAVYKGGTLLNAPSFAEAVGDTAMLERMRREKARAWGLGIPLMLAGTGAMVAGLVLVADQDIGIGGPLVLSIVGATGLTIGLYLPILNHGKRQFVARYYGPDEADPLIEEYNVEVREELGLTEAQTVEIDCGDPRCGRGRYPRREAGSGRLPASTRDESTSHRFGANKTADQ